MKKEKNNTSPEQFQNQNRKAIRGYSCMYLINNVIILNIIHNIFNRRDTEVVMYNTKETQSTQIRLIKKWWVESDFKAPNLPLSLRFKGSGCHCNSI
jgi:type IV secretory pathway component VirB8